LAHIVIVYFKEQKVLGEHIYWDQASLLLQIGMLDSQKWSVTGIEQVRKVLDESLPSNQMMEHWLKKSKT